MEVFGTLDRWAASLLLLLLLAYVPIQQGRFRADLDVVLSGLLKEEAFREVNGHNKVAVGFGSCLDVFVDALSLFRELDVSPPAAPVHHDVIGSSRELAETFAYFFEYGAAAERYVSDDEAFQQWVNKALEQPACQQMIGGNAPVMAERLAREGWQVVLGAIMKESTAESLRPMHVVRLLNSSSERKREDIHLILEYNLGQSWGKFSSVRANRFIVHSDYSNMRLESLQPFADALEQFQPDLVVIGGLQMLDNFPLDMEERTSKLKKIRSLIQSLPSTTKVHFEMASITEKRLLSEIAEYVLPHVDSLGMNEQELANLCSFLQHGKVTLVTDSNPRIATSLDHIRTLYDIMTRNVSSSRMLSRIHVHTLAFQAILISKHSSWTNIVGAVAKSSLTANRHVCASDNIDTSVSKLLMDDSFSISSSHGSQRMPLIETAPISCWSETDVKICVGPNLVCRVVQQTAGGGDNISAAGLSLQL